jgi:3-oxoacyl-[acyl-carrier protein] reductase
MQSLSELTAVVTGSSSGIGRAIAIELARGGAKLIVHGSTNSPAVEQTANSIRKLGQWAVALCCDISVNEQRDRFVEECWNQSGRPDIWVNNAGADVLTGEAAEWTFEQKLHRIWEVDVVGTIALSRLVGTRMYEAEYAESPPVIINIGWDQAQFGMAGESGELFATSKGAVMAFTRSLAKSLSPRVRVNCVAPGWIKTKWGETASDYWQQRAIAESLLERWGTPEDVAKAVKYLVSPDAGFVTGQTLCVNGGYRGEVPG